MLTDLLTRTFITIIEIEQKAAHVLVVYFSTSVGFILRYNLGIKKCFIMYIMHSIQSTNLLTSPQYSEIKSFLSQSVLM